MHSIGSETYYKNKASNVILDQVEAMEAVSIGGTIGTANVAIIATWLCRNNPHNQWIFGWLVLKLLAALCMILVEVRHQRVPLTETNAPARLRRLVAFPGINGAFWATGVLLMWEAGNLETQLMIMLLTVAMSAAALLELKSYLPALFLFFVPAASAFLLAAIWHQDQNTLLIILSGAAFIFWSVRHAFIEHRRLIRNLYKKYEVADLTTKLQEQITIAETATQAKSRFLAAASHDLRQPMHALNLYLGALANFNLPEPARPVLENVKECATTMDDMFAALLDISRLDASALEANFSVFPVATILNKIYLEFSQQANAKGLKLRIVPCSAKINADAELLENILRNLVSNAVRYTKQGDILVGCRRTASGIRIGVYDTGIGIDAELQPKIFEEFFQVTNHARDRSQGLGLGLAISQRQAQLMQSVLTLRSKPGRGSVFEIELKLSDAASTRQKAVHGLVMNSSSLVGVLVVVVDDESIILDAAGMLLEQWGCEVVAARSGKEALQYLTATTRVPDVIVCDHRLRDGESGIDVVDSLRNEFSIDIPALLITGDTSPEQILAITNAGFSVMYKPLQSATLKRALLEMIIRNGQAEFIES